MTCLDTFLSNINVITDRLDQIRDNELQTRLFGNFSGCRDVVLVHVVDSAVHPLDDATLSLCSPFGRVVLSASSSPTPCASCLPLPGTSDMGTYPAILIVGETVADAELAYRVFSTLPNPLVAYYDTLTTALTHRISPPPRATAGDAPLAEPPLGSGRQFAAAVAAPSPVAPGGTPFLTVLGHWLHSRARWAPGAARMSKGVFTAEFVRRVRANAGKGDRAVCDDIYAWLWPGAAERLARGELTREVWTGSVKRAGGRADEALSLVPRDLVPIDRLDIGADDGLVVAELGRKVNQSLGLAPGAGSCLAIDVSRPRTALPPTVTFMEEDATQPGVLPAGSVDLTTVMMTLHHVPHWKDVIRNTARWLRPGGVLVVRDHDAAGKTTGPARRLMLDLHDLLFATCVYEAQEQSYDAFANAAFNNFSERATVTATAVEAGLTPIGSFRPAARPANLGRGSRSGADNESVDNLDDWVMQGCVYYAAFRRPDETELMVCPPKLTQNPFVGALEAGYEAELMAQSGLTSADLTTLAATPLPDLVPTTLSTLATVAQAPTQASPHAMADSILAAVPAAGVARRILDFGCGNGALLAALGAARGLRTEDLVGVDVLPCPCPAGSSAAYTHHTQTKALSALTPGTYGLTYARLSLHHVPAPAHPRLALRLALSVAPGGALVVIDVPATAAPAGDAAHILRQLQSSGTTEGAEWWYPDLRCWREAAREAGLTETENMPHLPGLTGLAGSRMWVWTRPGHPQPGRPRPAPAPAAAPAPAPASLWD